MKIRSIHFIKQDKPALYIQIYEAIKQDILNGSLRYQDQLPSIRKGANDLSVSKTSIENAYQRLLLEGYIVSVANKGYFIDVDKHSIKLRRSIVAPKVVNSELKVRYDLRTSTIDSMAFNRTLWLHYIKEVLYNEDVLAVYGDPQGELRLREALLSYVYSVRGVLASSEQIVVGASFQSLLYSICSLYEGIKYVGFEKGGFPQAEQVFIDCGYRIIYLDIDDEGIMMKQLDNYNLGMIFINSASCGLYHRSIHSKRRSELLEYAKINDVIILEDDHNGELRYHTKMRPAMQGFDKQAQVIYLRSFSKLLFPSLRISFMVLNDKMSKQYQNKKQYYNPTASKIEQLALANYILDNQLEKQVRRLRKRYEHKSNCMINAISNHFKNSSTIIDESNLQIYIKLDRAVEVSLMDKLQEKGIYIPHPSNNHLTLSFASILEEDIDSVIESIANCYNET